MCSASNASSVLKGVSHWILDQQPDTMADLLLDWFAAHPAASRSV
jgi:hypothetical protein